MPEGVDCPFLVLPLNMRLRRGRWPLTGGQDASPSPDAGGMSGSPAFAEPSQIASEREKRAARSLSTMIVSHILR
jgi:hypothetical protein